MTNAWPDWQDSINWPDHNPETLYVYPDPVQFPNEECYTLTSKQGEPGWETDSGQPGYGLPKEIAVEIAVRYNNPPPLTTW